MANNDPVLIPYVIQEGSFWYVAYKEKNPFVPEITVSAKGIANHMSEEINDGCDFGPDSYNPSVTSGVPLTQTSGIQEAIIYAVSTIQLHYGDVSNDTSIIPIFPNIKLGVGFFEVNANINLQPLASAKVNGISHISGMGPYNTVIGFANDLNGFIGNNVGIEFLMEDITFAPLSTTDTPNYYIYFTSSNTNTTSVYKFVRCVFTNAYPGTTVNDYAVYMDSPQARTIIFEDCGWNVNGQNNLYINGNGTTPRQVILKNSTTVSGGNGNFEFLNVPIVVIDNYVIGAIVAGTVDAIHLSHCYWGNGSSSIMAVNSNVSAIEISNSYISTSTSAIITSDNSSNTVGVLSVKNTIIDIGADTVLASNFKVTEYIEKGLLTILNGYTFDFPGQTSVSGTTAGSFVANQINYENGYKKVIIYLNAYENDSTTAQTYTFPVAFSTVAVISTNSASVPGVSTSLTEFSIAPDTTTAYTGIIVIEGY